MNKKDQLKKQLSLMLKFVDWDHEKEHYEADEILLVTLQILAKGTGFVDIVDGIIEKYREMTKYYS